MKSMRGGAVAARVAHNHEVAGSNPAPATNRRRRLMSLTRRLPSARPGRESALNLPRERKRTRPFASPFDVKPPCITSAGGVRPRRAFFRVPATIWNFLIVARARVCVARRVED